MYLVLHDRSTRVSVKVIRTIGQVGQVVWTAWTNWIRRLVGLDRLDKIWTHLPLSVTQVRRISLRDL